jgi:hypothetical protein
MLYLRSYPDSDRNSLGVKIFTPSFSLDLTLSSIKHKKISTGFMVGKREGKDSTSSAITSLPKLPAPNIPTAVLFTSPLT